MKVMTIGATTPAKLEATGYLLGGVATVAGLVLMATGKTREGYAILISAAIVGAAVTATQVVSR